MAPISSSLLISTMLVISSDIDISKAGSSGRRHCPESSNSGSSSIYSAATRSSAVIRWSKGAGSTCARSSARSSSWPLAERVSTLPGQIIRRSRNGGHLAIFMVWGPAEVLAAHLRRNRRALRSACCRCSSARRRASRGRGRLRRQCHRRRPVLSCPVLSRPVLSCPVLSCLVLSCPAARKKSQSEQVRSPVPCPEGRSFGRGAAFVNRPRCPRSSHRGLGRRPHHRLRRRSARWCE